MSKRYSEQTEVPVHIPTLDGTSVAETILVKVSCRIDQESGEAILGGEALRVIDEVKARHMGQRKEGCDLSCPGNEYLTI